MRERILKMRVRPSRIAVLVNRLGCDADLLLAFEFLSRVWGGRYGQILPVDSSECDELTAFRLGKSRPDFIYGIGLDEDAWRAATLRTCQPREYSSLRSNFSTDRASPLFSDSHFRSDHILFRRFETRAEVSGETHTLRAVIAPSTSPLHVYCSAIFGTHDPASAANSFDSVTPFDGYGDFGSSRAGSLVRLATEFVVRFEQSWLDAGCHALDTYTLAAGPGFGAVHEPVIVLVNDHIADLCLFWNLRGCRSRSEPACVIPIPRSETTDPTVLSALKDWLLAFAPYWTRPNYCVVTSATVTESDCCEFAIRLQDELRGSRIEFVDYVSPRKRLPVVVPYEYEVERAVDIDGLDISFEPPRPLELARFNGRCGWFVDLLNDTRTGRAVADLDLPSSAVMPEILIAPSPVSPEIRRPARMGGGPDSISIHCAGRDNFIDVTLPTCDEIGHEVLREAGYCPKHDEKRSAYVPVIERFGGLRRAAMAFTGRHGRIIATLRQKPKLLAEIMGEAKLGRAPLADGGSPHYLDVLSEHLPPRTLRVARSRHFAQASQNDDTVNDCRTLLEGWANRAIVARNWQVTCDHCRQSYFITNLDIRKPITCTNCGQRVTMPSEVPIGYRLTRPVKLAIKEGLAPVVLTARFLQELTRRSFIWLPGTKFGRGTESGDVDILAYCDRHLVLCECKNLSKTPPGSIPKKVIPKFLETAEVAIRCGASLVVLASCLNEYPEAAVERIKSALGQRIPYALLTNGDLESGCREFANENGKQRQTIADFVNDPFQDAPISSPGRKIEFNFGTLSS